MAPGQMGLAARGLIWLLSLSSLSLAGSQSPNLYSQSDLAAEQHKGQLQAQQQTGCDLLFMVGDNLAQYCHCKDAAEAESLQLDSGDSMATSPDNNSTSDNNNKPQLVQINLLSCSPHNFSQIIRDLFVLQQQDNSSAAPSTAAPLVTFQIDYLNINTTLTSKLNFPFSSGGAQNAAMHLMLIDHISIQLVAAQCEEGPEDNRQITIEEQMIDFTRLINETRLRFLSIFLGHQCHQPTGSGGSSPETRLAKLMARFSSLGRLELSLSRALLLEAHCFRQQSQLKWLNLASNSELRFSLDPLDPQTKPSATTTNNMSPFAFTPNLEYLSLEANNLESFPIFSLLAAAPFKLQATTYHGLANLSSLNLAANKLASFELGLFAQLPTANETVTTICQAAGSRHDRHSKVFLLPALTQLDLSSNRLTDLTFVAAQNLLCSMPNLNQLFLQRNKIFHLNLNALLAFPQPQIKSNSSSSPVAIAYSPADAAQRHSRLEYIDLSHNNLIRVSAIQPQASFSSSIKARVRTIDLSHNNLKLPLLPVDSSLINRLVFRDSFAPIGLLEGSLSTSTTNSLDLLEASFAIYDNSTWTSLCDFLSAGAPKQSTVGNYQTSPSELLNEVILSNNHINRLAKSYFSSQQCRDLQLLRLAKNQISIIESEALNTLFNLEQLDLSFNYLTHLSAPIFAKNKRLKILNLAMNRIRSLSKDVFSHLLELEEISLQENDLFSISSELFSHNKRLIIVDLSRNKLTNLDKSTFSGLSQLKVLNLHGNHLKKITHLLFEKTNNNLLNESTHHELTQQPNAISLKQSTANFASSRRSANLRSQKPNSKKKRTGRQSEESNNVLILANNQIDQFRLDDCDPFTLNVQLLWLNDNRLKELGEASLKCLRSVQRLYVSSNRIRSIEKISFKQLNQLEYLDLSKNQLISIQDNSFAHSSSLRHVDLSRNYISDLNPLGLFTSDKEDTVQIESLNLSENFNLSLQCAQFFNFLSKASPRKVELNNVKKISCEERHNSTLKERLYLEAFSMGFNQIIEASMLEALENPLIVIDRLDLSFNILPANSMDKLGSLVRNRLGNGLTELNLGGNQLSVAQISTMLHELHGHCQLISLDLNSNSIDQWPFNSSSANKMKSLNSLNLSKNKIRYLIRDQLFDYEFPNLETLNLSSNAMSGILAQPFAKLKSLKTLMPKLKQLDLSHNRITWLPDLFFNKLDQLHLLKLDHNLLETFAPAFNLHQTLTLDLSFNHKLRSFSTETSRKDGDDYYELMNDVILYQEQKDWKSELKCRSIHEYIAAQGDAMPSNEVDFEGVQTETYQGDQVNDADRCQEVIKLFDSIKLDSTIPHLSWDSLDTGNHRRLHVSLRNNVIAQVSANVRNNKISVLDLGQNKIQAMPASLCQHFPELVSLGLGDNELNELPSLVISCSKLTYLDLSFNRLSTIKLPDQSKSQFSSIRVLRLDHNMLKHFILQDLSPFKYLRYIDLRYNQLQLVQLMDQLRPSLPFVVASDLKLPQETTELKPRLRGDGEDSLIIESPSEPGSKFSMNLYQTASDDRYNSEQKESSRYVIRFCSLKNQTASQFCLKSLTQEVEERCLYLRRPADIPLCLTNLQDTNRSNVTTTSNLTADSSKLMSNVFERNADLSKHEEDPVLSFIDILKRSWLKLKEFNFNEYLISLSNIRSDSVWMQVGGKYPVYTLTIIKVAMVCGSVCIIALLIAMFTLLTYLSSSQDSCKVDIKSSDGIITDNETSRSSTNNKSSMSDDSVLRTQSSFPSTSQTCSSSRSASNTSKDDTQQPTVIENPRSTTQQLDVSQLAQLQPSSTPSSSIAPSSVETGETLQAIDSIQSGTSIYNGSNCGKTSIDQYSEAVGGNFISQQPQVATVMRMVKSSSANFDSNKRHQHTNQHYGTLKSRNYSNYSILKSKIRAMQEHQHHAHQVYPVQVSQQSPQQQQQQILTYYDHDQIQQVVHNHPMAYSYNNSHLSNSNFDVQPQQEIDPATMSLISINSAISSGLRSSGSQAGLPETITGGVTQPDQFSNLCNYHKYTRDANDHFSSDIILEQEEEHQAPINLMLVGNLPPPPSSRAIEVLENNSIQYLSSLPGNVANDQYRN